MITNHCEPHAEEATMPPAIRRLVFPTARVEALIARLHTSRTPRRMLLVVGEGAYLAIEGSRGRVVHAEGCDPATDRHWREHLARCVGRSPFTEVVDHEAITDSIDHRRDEPKLILEIHRDAIEIILVRRSPVARKRSGMHRRPPRRS